MSVVHADTARAKSMLGIFGGTFDPVHIGHLQPVAEAAKEVGLEQVRLLPCHIPPHKQAPQSSAEHRLAMLELACQQWPLFITDTRELMWDTPSYSIDTLKDFRSEIGERPLLFFVGMDSLCHLDSWYEWQSICNYCHLVVCQRGDFLPDFNVNITRLLNERRTTDVKLLEQEASGRIYLARTSQIPVSSTTIRAALCHGDIDRSWLPDKVLDYIEKHQLYRQCE